MTTRIRSRSPRVTGGGGGGPTPGGIVAWGPDFGDGSDGTSVDVTAALDLEALALLANLPVTATPDLDALALSGTVGTVTATVDGSALGSPFWQSLATGATSGAVASSVVVAKPSGTVQTDLLVAHVTSSTVTAIVAPAGWTTIQSASSPGITKVTAFTFWKLAGASEPANYTFTGGSGIWTGEIHRLNGTHQTTPIDVSAITTLNATALDPDPVSPSVTTTVINCLAMRFLAHSHGVLSQTHTPAASHVEVSDFEGTGAASTTDGAHGMTRVFAPAAATGTAVHNCTEITATDAVMTTIAVRPGTLDLVP